MVETRMHGILEMHLMEQDRYHTDGDTSQAREKRRRVDDPRIHVKAGGAGD